MRFAAYVGASTALATAVIFHAFNQRPNFYSAVVYLAQSQACRMILLNLVLLTTYTFVRALQKALYGPLRPIEREQLWDKSWYAVTETALAMTTFRDEVGVYFMVMFISLLAGKVWMWISEGRVEILEQQPPANPRVFHMRMMASLFISELFDILMLRYCVNTLINQPKPGMMVMFAFEFAVLFIMSSSTTLRYILSLQEILVVKRQTQAKVQERKEEIRTARQEVERQARETGEQPPAPREREEDVDENDIDVPGWQEKGQWVLFLDLFTDFMKLIIYMFFFAMLILFHGIPIHIIRDVYLTMRSFLKRIADFQKYRYATRDMNARYPDATAQELQRDGTCIICREEMRPWEQATPQQPEQPGAPPGQPRRPARGPPDERQRPKKLPCGHVLHLGCLKSWLERQQVCPTCRTSVLAPDPSRGDQAQGQPGRPAANAAAPGQHAQPGGQQQPGQHNIRARQWRFGPWRFTFAMGDNARGIQDRLNQMNGRADTLRQRLDETRRENAEVLTQAQQALTQHQQPVGNDNDVSAHLGRVERGILSEIQRLQLAEQQLQGVRALQYELGRLRAQQDSIRRMQQAGNVAPNLAAMQPRPVVAQQGPVPGVQQGPIPGLGFVPAQFAQQRMPQPAPQPTTSQQQPEVLAAHASHGAFGPGHADLPEGFSLPQGWSLLPLQRQPGGPVASPQRQTNQSQGSWDQDLPTVLRQVERPPNARQGQSPYDARPPPSIYHDQQPPSIDVYERSSEPTTPSGEGTDSSAVNLPDWASNAQTDGVDETKTEQPTPQRETPTSEPKTTTSDPMPRNVNGHASSTEGKGKSRAPTVQDDDEVD